MTKNTSINWKIKHFSELSALEWHDIAKIRMEIFIIEQNCIYLDLDNKDLDAYHIFGEYNGEIVAYARLLDKNITFPEVSIGRVVVSQKYRAKSIGHLLMQEVLKFSKTKYPLEPIKISAQEHLTKFYEAHDFVVVTESYLEDGIPHVGMLRN